MGNLGDAAHQISVMPALEPSQSSAHVERRAVNADLCAFHRPGTSTSAAMAAATVKAAAAEATVKGVTMEGMIAEVVVVKSAIKIFADESADAQAMVRQFPFGV